MATWDDVANVVGELQLTEERAPHEWRVGKKLIAWERPLRTSDYDALTAVGVEPPQGDILGVRVADEGVKFAAIDEGGLRELIVEAWLTQAPKRLVQEFLDETR